MARFNLINLIVADLDRMARFYGDAFGFAENSRIAGTAFEEVMLAQPENSFTLVLFRYTDGRAIKPGSAYGPIGFLVRDLPAEYAASTSAGFSEDRAPDRAGKMQVSYVRDPEGNEIELLQLPHAA